jgi:hypothetical protein
MMEKEEREMFGASNTPREREAMRTNEKAEGESRKMFGASMTPRERMEVQRMLKRESRKGRR